MLTRGSALAASAAMIAFVAIPAGVTSASQRAHAKTPLTVDVFAPFSGASAAYGNFANLPGVKTGVEVVNGLGGVLGHQINIITTDDLGDVADAVPIAHQLVATNPNLTAVFGNPGQEAFETSKIFSDAHIVEFSVAGFNQLNRVLLPYFWRTFPPDSAESTAWAGAIVTTVKHARVAIINSSTTDTASAVPPLVTGIKRGGGKVVLNITVQPDLPSYASVIQRIQATHPTVLAWDFAGDDQTSATFVTQLQEFGLLKLPQILASTTPDWEQAVSAALHTDNAGLGQYFTFVAPQAGAIKSYNAFLSAFETLYPSKSGPFNAYNMAMYDGVIITALAMTEAKSVVPRVFNKMIPNVTSPGPGKVRVYDYPTAIKMLKEGKQIQYIGASGVEVFNHYHWTNGNWQVIKPTASGFKTIKVLTATELRKLS